MNKKHFLLLLTFVCLYAANAWGMGTYYGTVYVHVVIDNSDGTYEQENISGIATVGSANGENKSDMQVTSTNGTSSQTISDWELTSKLTIKYTVKATPNAGYVFDHWSVDAVGGSSESKEFIYSSTFQTNKGSSSPEEKHVFAHFIKTYTSSYTPQVGSFKLLNVRNGCFLEVYGIANDGKFNVRTTTDIDNATVFTFSNVNSSTSTTAHISFIYNATTYYWGQQIGNQRSFDSEWTITQSNVSGYCFMCNYNNSGEKGGEYDRYMFMNANGEFSLPRDQKWTEYDISWILVPVYTFAGSAPSIIGGEILNYQVTSEIITPTLSDDMNSATTTASISAGEAETGYIFKGWWDNSDFTGEPLTTNTMVTSLTSESPIKYTIYPKFVPVFNFSATATKNVAGEEGGTVSATVDYEEIEGTTPGQASATTTATFTATPFTDDGYSFEAWYTPGGDFVSYANPYVTTLENTHLDGTTESLTLQAHFTLKTIPVFTFHMKVGIKGQTYGNVFRTSNEFTSLTSVTNSNPSVANVTYNLSARTISIEALEKGQTTITIVQNGDETYTNKTLSYTITVVEQGEWIWQQDEVSSGNSYYIYSSTSGFLNDADGFDSSPTLLWTVGGTALSKYSLTASSGKTLSIYDNDWKWNVTTSGTYSGGDINLESSLSDGYYSIWREGGAHMTFGYGSYYVASKNGALEMWSSASYEWLFVSSAQKAAYDSYIAASEYVGSYTSRYPSLENELSAVIGSNNYESADWATCKANLDAIIAKCDAFDADYAKFNEDGNKRTINTTADGFATIYYACPIELPDGVTAYKGSYSDGVLTLTDIDCDGRIPACTPVVLYKENTTSSSTITLSYDDGEGLSSISGNKLHGSSYDIPLSSSSVTIDGVNGTAYGLGQKDMDGNGTVEAGFFRYSTTAETAGANKAILVIDGDGPSLAAIRIISEENNTTDIDMFQSTPMTEIEKFMENGQLLIKRDGVVYDVLGRIVK